MLIGSAFAYADASNEWAFKCFEKNHHEVKLAYIIKVDRPDPTIITRKIELLDCTRSRGEPGKNCRERGYLKRIERQEETCLVLGRHNDFANGSWSLCHEEQKTALNPRLVPVTVTDDRQESRIYCEKELLQIL
jgi:hypothetical protein